MRVALCQFNPTVGDLGGNLAALLGGYRRAVDAGADLVVTGELGLTGYPPEDLVTKPAFVRATARGLEELAASTGSVTLVVGFVEDVQGEDETTVDTVMSEAETTRTLANAAAVLRDGRIVDVYRKQRIPNYGVFDEARYFQPGSGTLLLEVPSHGTRSCRVGVTICEDLWGDGGPLPATAAAGADVLLSLNASPYQRGKREQREHWAVHHARSTGTWLVYCNLVGGQDEVVFDGDSFVVAPDGAVTARGAQFTEDIVLTEVGPAASAVPTTATRLEPETAIYDALVLGTRDYLGKNGFADAIVGVSGGIDSALAAAIAVDALGPARVTCVAMPSPYSSQGSLEDAEALASLLGTPYRVLPIEGPMKAFEEALAPVFAGTEPDVAEENLQSRIRGALLMAQSNKFGALLLAAGNKSEYAVGYATLYGDMAGGLAVLKDVDKTTVWALARRRNGGRREGWLGPDGPAIPERSITKPPSAELRPDQQDTDSLPPYEVLDPVLRGYVEEARSVDELVADGFDRHVVREVARLVDGAEYKRRQAPPGIKVTARAFGRDRRWPITQAWPG
ncbi:NAD+ synthase [Egibacter rhizosphaerae]|uniref:Glutamine-dependent NAD(+) synthetase n=1 Tax=Egibacter rhizosphaerae TaxID=1670831 RepID=A0A411YAN1_9ACTN|nr:NAD+ synthase [Egibacter rhizosphaerae]QBI18238.1 NAD+ synthase [Egibacter rhizosphaerae]